MNLFTRFFPPCKMTAVLLEMKNKTQKQIQNKYLMRQSMFEPCKMTAVLQEIKNKATTINSLWSRPLLRRIIFISIKSISIVSIIIAIGFHYAIYQRFWADQGVDFSIPVSIISWILIGGWVLVILASILPIKRAMDISPSAALRSID